MKVFIFYFLLLIPIGQMAFSQNTISGTVKDQTGQPLPGATVMIENTNRGTTTDFDGNFNISASKGEILAISFVGFTTVKITISDNKTVNVTLQEDQAGNLKPSKSKSVDRIDPVVALVMSIGCHLTTESSDSVYDERDILVL